MGLTILAGGCRQETDDGKVFEKRCGECFAQGGCEFEPRARELAQAITHQWVRIEQHKPPQGIPILYLEYPSAAPNGTVHLGCYNEAKKRFQTQTGRKGLSEDKIIAWMAVPQIPMRIFEGHHPMGSMERLRSLECPRESLFPEP